MDSYNIKKWDWNLSTGFRWQQVGDHISYQRRRPVSNDLTILNLLKLKSIFFNCVYWQRVNSFFKKRGRGCLFDRRGEKRGWRPRVEVSVTYVKSGHTCYLHTLFSKKSWRDVIFVQKHIFQNDVHLYFLLNVFLAGDYKTCVWNIKLKNRVQWLKTRPW